MVNLDEITGPIEFDCHISGNRDGRDVEMEWSCPGGGVIAYHGTLSSDWTTLHGTATGREFVLVRQQLLAQQRQQE